MLFNSRFFPRITIPQDCIIRRFSASEFYFCLIVFLFLIEIQAHQQLHMLPNVKEQVIQAGSNLQLTCIFTFEEDSENKENDVEIEWIFPCTTFR